MSTIILEIYEAFKTAGVPEEQAKNAAKAISSETLSTKDDITELKVEIKGVRGDLKLMKWMLGIVIAVQVLPLLKAVL